MNDVWMARICSREDLPADGRSAVFRVDGRRIAIFGIQGKHYAIDDTCSHAESSLGEEGEIQGTTVRCALHFACFDLETGKVLRGPTRVNIRTYALDVGESVVATEQPLLKRARTVGGDHNG